jgi:AraC-like DNA-binding protein
VIPGSARGVLHHASGPGRFHHARLPPATPLNHFVQHYWIVRWDLRGHAPQLRETLPHPNVHLVFERARTRIFGVHTARYTRVLEGEGCVFGVKFRPGGLRPFLGRSVSTIANASVSLEELFGARACALEDTVLDCADETAMIDVVARFLTAWLPAQDPHIDLAAAIVARIEEDRSLTTVDAVVERSGLGTRALQRLFKDYVGVGPKWVINRYRLHEAIDQLARGEVIDWSTLALDLGYFDQAHFIRDFKKLVGRTPASYARSGESRRA